MKIDQLKYNIQFGNIPEGQYFIKKANILNLNTNDLGKYFKYIGNTIKDDFTGISFQLLGLTSKEFSENVIYLKTSKKLPYLKYYTNFMPIYYIIFKIHKQNEPNIKKLFKCSIDTFKTEFELIE